MTYSRYANNKTMALLDQPLTRMCNCWKITRLDAVSKYLTDHDQPVTFNAWTFTPTGGANSSDLSSESGLKEDNLEIVGVIDDSVIPKEDLRDGLYDGASVTQYVVDWMYPWTGIFEEMAFFIGDITWNKDIYRCQMVGITQQLNKTLGRTAQELCPNVFGEHPCQNTVTSTGPTIRRWGGAATEAGSSFDEKLWFIAPSTLPLQSDGYYNGVRVEFYSGTNSGQTGYINEYYASVGPKLCQLILPMNADIDTGDNVYIYNICDKTFGVCQLHGNNKNFGGNPDMPGMDKVTSGPDSAY